MKKEWDARRANKLHMQSYSLHQMNKEWDTRRANKLHLQPPLSSAATAAETNSKHWFTTSFLWRKVPESDAWSVRQGPSLPHRPAQPQQALLQCQQIVVFQGADLWPVVTDGFHRDSISAINVALCIYYPHSGHTLHWQHWTSFAVKRPYHRPLQMHFWLFVFSGVIHDLFHGLAFFLHPCA